MVATTRSGRGRSSARRRPAARTRTGAARPRGRPRGRSSGGSWKAPVAVAALALGVLVYDWLAARPEVFVALVVAVVVGGLGGAVLFVRRWRSRRRRERERTRSIAEADGLTGTEFEQWVAALMRRTGFLDVQVSGGAGDLGADIVAQVPDGRLVVQCKRHREGRPVGSPDVQRFAGTAQALHHADVAAIVTTSGFTAPAADAAARLGIGLVDRAALARWAAEGRPPEAFARARDSGP